MAVKEQAISATDLATEKLLSPPTAHSYQRLRGKQHSNTPCKKARTVAPEEALVISKTKELVEPMGPPRSYGPGWQEELANKSSITSHPLQQDGLIQDVQVPNALPPTNNSNKEVAIQADDDTRATGVADPTNGPVDLPCLDSLPPLQLIQRYEELLHEPTASIHTMLGYTWSMIEERCLWQCGQQNLGNTCYANSLLFAMIGVAAFRCWVREHQRLHQHANNHCILCSVGRDLHNITSFHRPNIILPETVTTRSQWCPQLANAEQQDVTQYWQHLSIACNDVDQNAHRHLVEDTILNQSTSLTTPLWHLCGIRGINDITCRTCGQKTRVHSCDTSLQLPIPDGPCKHCAHASSRIIQDRIKKKTQMTNAQIVVSAKIVEKNGMRYPCGLMYLFSSSNVGFTVLVV